MIQAGFRAAISDRSTFMTDAQALAQLPARPSGGAPDPFDALDALRMSGPQGSHPLAAIDLAALVPGPTPGLEGVIDLDGPVRVGEVISGTIRVRARRSIEARSAVLRLVGVHLAERRCSSTEKRGAGGVQAEDPGPDGTTQTVSWVEIHGSVIESLPFRQPLLPASLEAGQVVELPFSVPAPRLGPPTAHAGVAAIAWALEAHWDIAMGTDERVCAPVEVGQHPDLLRAGVLTLPSGAMNDTVTDEDASISVDPLPPVPAGGTLAVTVAWPGAPGGRSARAELDIDVEGGSRLGLMVASVPVDHEALERTSVTLPLASDLPPTLEVPDLKVGYRIRVVVDRKLRSDASRERPVVIF